MRSRIQYEDIIQEALVKIVPQIAPQNIRPAYQDYDIGGTTQSIESGIDTSFGFTPEDNFIYFTIRMDNTDAKPQITESGDISIRREMTVYVYCSGKDSPAIATIISAVIRTNALLNFLEQNDIYLQDTGSVDEMWELKNEQWFERHDFTFKINVNETITTKLAIDTAEEAPVHVETTGL